MSSKEAKLSKFLHPIRYIQRMRRIQIQNTAQRDIVDTWADVNAAKEARAKRIAKIRERFKQPEEKMMSVCG